MDKKINAVLVHPDDNVLIATTLIKQGADIHIPGESLTALDQIQVGHKVARAALQRGAQVIKFGAPIGSMTADTQPGAHVHLHNMKSDYINTHSRESVNVAKEHT